MVFVGTYDFAWKQSVRGHLSDGDSYLSLCRGSARCWAPWDLEPSTWKPTNDCCSPVFPFKEIQKATIPKSTAGSAFSRLDKTVAFCGLARHVHGLLFWQLRRALRWLGHFYSFDMVQHLVSELDVDGDCMLDFTLFVKLISSLAGRHERRSPEAGHSTRQENAVTQSGGQRRRRSSSTQAALWNIWNGYKLYTFLFGAGRSDDQMCNRR